MIGHGGIRLVARAAGVGRRWCPGGVDEVAAGELPRGRVRATTGPAGPGRAGRARGPDVAAALDDQVAVPAGHRIDRRRVPDIGIAEALHEEGFSLQANAKTLEVKLHPDQDAQFRCINAQAEQFQATGDPVVSVDCKKKELVGQFKNPGCTWRSTGDPILVDSHDFPGRELGKAIAYGVYDIAGTTV